MGVEQDVEEVVVLHARQAEQGVDPDPPQGIDDEVRDGVLGAVGHVVHRRVAPCGSRHSSRRSQSVMAGVLTSCAASADDGETSTTAESAAAVPTTYAYGDSPEQFATLSLPATPGRIRWSS